MRLLIIRSISDPLYALDIVCIDSHRTTTKVLEENFGNRPGFTSVCGRIDRINEAELHRRNQLSESEELAEIENDPPLQFVFGGPPCQSFSKNNFFKVDNDRRSFEPAVRSRNTSSRRSQRCGKLIFHLQVFLDHLRIYRPIAGIFENVSAIEDFVDADGQSLLLSFEAILRSMGYQMLCAHYNCQSIRSTPARVIVHESVFVASNSDFSTSRCEFWSPSKTSSTYHLLLAHRHCASLDACLDSQLLR